MTMSLDSKLNEIWEDSEKRVLLFKIGFYAYYGMLVLGYLITAYLIADYLNLFR